MIQIALDNNRFVGSLESNLDGFVLAIDNSYKELDLLVVTNVSDKDISMLKCSFLDFEIKAKIIRCGDRQDLSSICTLLAVANEPQRIVRYEPDEVQPFLELKTDASKPPLNSLFQLHKINHFDFMNSSCSNEVNSTLKVIAKYYGRLLFIFQDDFFNSGFEFPESSTIRYQYSFKAVENLLVQLTQLEKEASSFRCIQQLIIDLKRSLKLILNLYPTNEVYLNNNRTVHRAFLGHAVLNYSKALSLHDTKTASLSFILCFRALDFYLTGICINLGLVTVANGYNGKEVLELGGKNVSGFYVLWRTIKTEYLTGTSLTNDLTKACQVIDKAIQIRNSNIFYHGTQHSSLERAFELLEATKILILFIEIKVFPGRSQKIFSENMTNLITVFSTDLSISLVNDLLLSLRLAHYSTDT